MKIVKVTYTVRPEFSDKNQGNIKAVMNDLRKLDNPGIRYATYLADDGKTFMHFAQFENPDLQQILFDLESFKSFQQQVKESGLEVPTKQEFMSLVASSFDIFAGQSSVE